MTKQLKILELELNIGLNWHYDLISREPIGGVANI